MKKSAQSLILLMTMGVFGILNTEMGVMGILPHIAKAYQVSLAQAGILVSSFALVVALAGPTMPLLFSKVNRKTVMMLATGTFALTTLLAIVAPNFWILVFLRMLPAVFHPVYVSMAMSVAANSVEEKDAEKAVARVFIGVSAGSLLGIPVSNFLANHFSLTAAMLFFAIINLLVFIGTVILVPSMPVTEGLSYGKQLGILKRPVVWISIVSILLLNGAVFGFSSYLSDFLDSVSRFEPSAISSLLLVIGLMNIVGNSLAGQWLGRQSDLILKTLPISLILLFLLLFVWGHQMFVVLPILLLFGIVAGIEGNANQYMIAKVGMDAPDFANGLFLAAANLGVTIGTSISGLFIAQGGGTQYSLLGSILLLVIGTATVFVRQKMLKKS
ncbi:MFS transporter [Streptococcus himalayensis]|uniref:MFS transporter n=1 Tax=Streptococcus himalayensis TaxID=1888195 RepID=A0A917EF66_9STRE|nr:MFS transporter [Streptococcus himalayensis]GGE33356.1 MFS transporter [Streptococcus himalayensis]